MGDVVSYPVSKSRKWHAAVLGMGVFSTLWTAGFLAMFLRFALHRTSTKPWPPLGFPEISLGPMALHALFLVLSSAALELGLRRLRNGRPRALAPAALAATVLGSAFMALEWPTCVQLSALASAEGSGAKEIYKLHTAQLTVGLGALAWTTVRSFQGIYSAPRHLPVRLWSTYWHTVVLVWLSIYLFVWVL